MADLSELIAITQEELGPLIQKPKLSEKHLSRPPFRFLHDIVTNLMDATGYLQGVFQGDELDSKAISDKHDKLAFLEKLIDHVSQSQGPVDVKATKIVAGAEPENTNLLLQVR